MFPNSLFPPFSSGLWFISEVKRKSAPWGPRVCSTVDGGGLESHTGARVCALTAHQWTIRPWLLMSCYPAHCRVTICSRCWRQASNSWRWKGGKQKGSGLTEKWMGRARDTLAYIHTCTTCNERHDFLSLLHSYCSNIRDNIWAQINEISPFFMQRARLKMYLF